MNIRSPVSIKTFKCILIGTSAEASVINKSEDAFHYVKHNIDLVYANVSSFECWQQTNKMSNPEKISNEVGI